MNFLKVRAEYTAENTVVIAGPDFPSKPLSLEKTKPVDLAPGAD